MNKMRIGVSKLAPNYDVWLKKADNDIEIINLYEMETEEAVKLCLTVSGILLTGGSDIHPSLYGRSVDLHHCRNIDEKRDKLELALIELAFSNKIPILGICRGLQILNVAKKGTLYADIPEYFKSSVPHSGETDVEHRANIKENSQLYHLSQVNTGIVNSSHHQSINNLGSGFIAVAHGPDFIVEAIEYDHNDHPFCIAVQWHPERMDFDNPLSGLLAKGFLEASYLTNSSLIPL